MADPLVMRRIDAWEAIGLVDHETAARLRSAEMAAESELPGTTDGASSRPTPLAAAFFGPGVSIAELFGYLGAGFILAAWQTILQSYAFGAGAAGPSAAVQVAQSAIPAIILVIAGLLARRGNPRRRRFAGVAFAVATWYVLEAAQAVLWPSGGLAQTALSYETAIAVAALVAAIAAFAFRRLHPAVLTQLALLGALATLWATLMQALSVRLYPSVGDGGSLDSRAAGVKVGLTIAWWLALALIFGLLARLEARGRSADDVDLDRAAATRRAVVSRFAAGLTAIAGTALAVTQWNGDARAVAPLIGDAAVLAVALLLFVLAVRRGSGAYLYPAAIGLVVAFTDLNTQYVIERTGTGVALLLEGLILIVAGFVADRLRRRLAAAADRGTDDGPPFDAPPFDAPAIPTTSPPASPARAVPGGE